MTELERDDSSVREYHEVKRLIRAIAEAEFEINMEDTIYYFISALIYNNFALLN